MSPTPHALAPPRWVWAPAPGCWRRPWPAPRGPGRAVGLCDVNAHRMAVHNGWLGAALAGRPCRRMPPRTSTRCCAASASTSSWSAPWTAPTTTTSCRRCEAGCDVVTEKPMTTDAAGCRRILDAVAATGSQLTVTFNYRYNPVHEAVHGAARRGAIGEILSVHFEWLLDTAPRRRLLPPLAPRQGEHRRPDGAQGHPPLRPGQLVAGRQPGDGLRQGGLGFYGDEAGERSGYAQRLRAGPTARRRGTTLRAAPGRQRRAARAVPRRGGARTATTATERVRRRHHHRGRHGGAGALRHRRHA